MNNLETIARKLRRDVITMSFNGHIGHVGSCLSMMDIVAALYFKVLNVNPSNPLWNERDRFVLSKGHAVAALYAALANRGFFPEAQLGTYVQNGSHLPGHPEIQCVPGVEITSGSLGHGLSIAVGMALAARIDGAAWRPYVMLSDGECDEGTVWEAAMAAGHFKLGNLTAIIDYNKFQALGKTADVMNLEPLKSKLDAFGWHAIEIDGHNVDEIVRALEIRTERPVMVIAHTTMGKGVSFMEGRLEWHYLDPKKDQFDRAMDELK